MKKIFTLLAAATLAAAPALADSLIPGADSLTPGEPDYNNMSAVPFCFDNDICYSASQSIFPAVLLNSIAPKTVGSETTTASITSVSFVIRGGQEIYSGMSGDFEFSVWIDNVEEETFPKVASKEQWMTYGEGGKGSATIEASVLEYDTDYTVTIPLDSPFEYSGGNLLFTFKGYSTAEEGYGMGFWFGGEYSFSPKLGHITSGLANGDSEPSMTGAFAHTTSTLPALELNYQTKTEEASGSPVSFDNVELKLESVGVTGNYYYSKANCVAATFDVVDPTNAGEYEISAGGTVLGTITGTSGTIRYIPVSSNDLILKIEAKGDGTVATNHTIAADDVQALFPVPTAEFTGEYALYSTYNFSTTTGQESDGKISGAAQFQMTSSVPVTRMQVATANPSGVLMMTPSNSYEDNIQAIMPEGVTSDNYNFTYATDGKFGVYYNNFATGKLTEEGMEWPASVSLTVSKLNALYPVVTQDALVLVAGKDALAETEEVSGTVTAIEKTVAGSITANMPLDETHFVFDPTYPSKMRVVEDNHNKAVQFFAPANTKIEYKFESDVTEASASGEWEVALSNPWTYNYKEKVENKQYGTFTLRTVDNTTDETAETYSKTIWATTLESTLSADKQEVKVYAPVGKSIYWILETKSRAENDWSEETANPYTIQIGNLEPGLLKVVAAAPNTSATELNAIKAEDSEIYTVNEDGTATSIKSVVATGTESVVIYDLQGRRLQNPAKGVNIVNGKKIIF